MAGDHLANPEFLIMATPFNLKAHERRLAANVTAPSGQSEMAEELRELVKENLLKSLRRRRQFDSEYIEPPRSFVVTEAPETP